MVREDLHLTKQPTWRLIFALTALTAILAILGLWIGHALSDRQRAALERTLASIASEKTVLHKLWLEGTVPATLLTAETSHIDEEAGATSSQLSELEQKEHP
jgi:hypothetical protein